MTARIFALLSLPAMLCGCRIARDQVNRHVREIDTSWIEPGITTRIEVMDRIGLPPTAPGVGGVTADSFRWTLLDKRTGTLEAGYIVTPTFELSTAHFSEDILVKFDGNGIVALVSRTASDGKNTRILEWRETK